jgi:hypothetical protein
MADDGSQLLFQLRDAFAGHSGVDLALRLALSSLGDAAAALAVKVPPVATDAGEHVLRPRQLHLKDGLARLRPFGEDVQNDLLPVGHAQAEQFFKVALLGRGERNVEDDHVAGEAFRLLLDLLRLARPDVVSGRRLADRDNLPRRNVDLQVARQFRQLVEQAGRVVVHFRLGDADKVRPRRVAGNAPCVQVCLQIPPPSK